MGGRPIHRPLPHVDGCSTLNQGLTDKQQPPGPMLLGQISPFPPASLPSEQGAAEDIPQLLMDEHIVLVDDQPVPCGQIKVIGAMSFIIQQQDGALSSGMLTEQTSEVFS